MAAAILQPLRKRAQFLAVAAGNRKCATPGLVVQCLPCPAQEKAGVRLGFTASRKVGNAVLRNRARRRLRALAREVIPAHVRAGDYVLIARAATPKRDYDALRRDLIQALQKLGMWVA
ncbi:MAG: ribonuclease P protein component [Alphaproteobacteria bacterium]|nr:ribonuclease P protein component [Alphaproteobacteria bacterium]